MIIAQELLNHSPTLVLSGSAMLSVLCFPGSSSLRSFVVAGAFWQLVVVFLCKPFAEHSLYGRGRATLPLLGPGARPTTTRLRQTPQTHQTHQTPQTPQTHQTPQTPQTHQTPQAPQTPQPLHPALPPRRPYGYGMPSAHAHFGFFVWGFVLSSCANRALAVAALAYAAVVSLSRRKQNLHTLQQIGVGAILGTVTGTLSGSTIKIKN